MAARLRRNKNESDPDLEPTTVNDRLKYKHGHRLMALAAELDKHLRAAGGRSFAEVSETYVHTAGECRPARGVVPLPGRLPGRQ